MLLLKKNCKPIAFAILIFVLTANNACVPPQNSKNSEESYKVKHVPAFYWQGHRGARGLAPENTFPAFKKAIDFGMNTMELDVVVTKDKKVVLSHEPFMAHQICLDTLGQPITEENEQNHNIYAMDYEEILRYDCGSAAHPQFPLQENQKIAKPLLANILDEVEKYVASQGKEQVYYNIEIKSSPEGDGVFHPAPSEFVDLVMEVITSAGFEERVFIQSFDPRPLQVLHQKYPKMQLVWLIANQLALEANLATLGFTPDVYSPYFLLVDKPLVQACQDKNMALIPWTVNRIADMEKLMALGVDGIITDYPDSAAILFK